MAAMFNPLENTTYDMGYQMDPNDYNNAYNRAQGPKLANGIAGGIGGIAGLYGNYEGLSHQADSIQTQAPPQQIDAYGRPQYNLGGLDAAANANYKPSQSQEVGERLSGVATGAAAGAPLGPLGMLGGALIGGISTLFGQKKRRKKIAQRQALAKSNLESAQKSYGTMVNNYQTKQLAMGDYYNKMNNTNRLQSLYDIQSGQDPNG